MKIHDLAVGRVFRDAIPDGDDFRLRFADGLEIVCAWGDAGPEVKSHRFGVITLDQALHPQFRYVTGKTVQAVYTDGQQLMIEFTDGHTLRSDFRTAPAVRGVDVAVKIPGAELFGQAQAL